MILVVLPFTFTKKSFGLKNKAVSKTKYYLGYGFNFLVFIVDSFVGVAGGLISSLIVIVFMGLTHLEANAVRKITGLTMSIVATLIFAYHGLIDYKVGLFLLIGGMLGSYFGTKLAIKKGNNLVKIVFTVVVIVSAIKLLFF